MSWLSCKVCLIVYEYVKYFVFRCWSKVKATVMMKSLKYIRLIKIALLLLFQPYTNVTMLLLIFQALIQLFASLKMAAVFGKHSDCNKESVYIMPFAFDISVYIVFILCFL